MLLLLLQFAAATAVIVVAGFYLTRFTDRLAQLTGLGRSLAGMMLLALATSLPELAVDCNAAAIGAADMAVGGLLGSSLMNLLLLAVLDLTRQSRGRMLSRMSAAHALTATAGILLTSLVALFVLIPLKWSLFGRLGLGSLAIVIAYFFSLRLIYLNQRLAAQKAEAPPGARDAEPTAFSLRGSVAGYLIAALVIFVAAPFLAIVADRLAVESGLGGTFIGTTLVALATSLPEAATTLAAVRLRAFDMAVSNILGSNVFNMVILAPVDLFQEGPLLAVVSTTHAVTAAWVIVVTSVAAMGQLYEAERRYWLLEPDATLVIVLVLLALASVYFLR